MYTPIYYIAKILWRTHSGKLVSLAAGDLPQHSEFRIKITAQEEITEMPSSNGPEVNKEQMEEQCNIFLVMFLKLYPTKHVTPYMHVLRWHVPEFIELYGKISPFTQQSLEKLNDKRLDALKQIVMKRSRIEHLKDVGCQREKRTFRCHNCKLEGHDIKTCTSKCNSCQTKPCCSPAHLVKVGGKWIKTCQ